jgi:hypothetical protein
LDFNENETMGVKAKNEAETEISHPEFGPG